MKKSILLSLIFILALLSQNAIADKRHFKGNNRHSSYGLNNNHYYSYNRYPRGNNFGIYIGGRHNRHDHFNAGSFVGGVVLGSLLFQPRNYDTHYYRPTAIRAGSQVTVVNPPGRRLLRDLEGRCYEISRNGRGGEIRTEIPSQSCNF